jgi:hypothetical protein
VVPAPTEPSEETDSKTQAKGNARSESVQPWIWVPTRPHHDGRSIYQPWVVARDVDDIRICWFDDDGLPLNLHLLLLVALQIAGFLCVSASLALRP